MKIAVLQFGGSNCDHDVLYVLTDVIGVDAELVWYKEELKGYDGVVVPGGFSYGDYLRAGAIAARTPIMDSVRLLWLRLLLLKMTRYSVIQPILALPLIWLTMVLQLTLKCSMMLLLVLTMLQKDLRHGGF